jgi:chorismate mutase-like protein
MTAEQAMPALAECRKAIDDVDLRILALLNERTAIVEEIGRIKRSVHLPIYEPRREDEVFRNVKDHNPGPLPHDSARRIFERIIDEMRVVQRLRMENAAKEQL